MTKYVSISLSILTSSLSGFNHVCLFRFLFSFELHFFIITNSICFTWWVGVFLSRGSH